MTLNEAARIEYVDSNFFETKPVVSVVMLVYNHEKYLAQAIDSVVRQQSSALFELIIGEDFSGDNSLGIAIEYQKRFPGIIRLITSDRNVGAHRNWVRLMESVRGEFIAHIDGDDYWLPGKISTQLELLQAAPGAVAVYSNAVTVDERGEVIGSFNDAGDAVFYLADLVRSGNFLCMSTMFFKAELTVSLFNIGREFIDYQLHLTLAQHGSIIHAQRMLAAYRVESLGSLVANKNALVRRLYWQAIREVPRSMVSDANYARGVADFMRRVVFRSIRTRSFYLLKIWAPRAYKASPYGAVRTTVLIAEAVLRISWRTFVARAGLSRRYGRVLYLK